MLTEKVRTTHTQIVSQHKKRVVPIKWLAT